ncbi:MAG: hypothetical protein AAGK23_03535 [Pseudomonadota bacterium]
MLRTGLGVLMGLVIGVAIIFVVENIGFAIFSNHDGLTVSEPLPLGAKIFDLVGWTLGIFGGGLAGGLIAGHRALIAWLVGLVLLGMAAMSLATTSYPQVFATLTIVLAIAAAGLASVLITHKYNKV